MKVSRIAGLAFRGLVGLSLLGALSACDTLTLPGELGTSTGGLSITRTSADPSKTSVAPGERITLSVEAESTSGATLSYRWTATGGQISGSGATVTWTAPESGTVNIQVEVSGGGGSANAAFRFRVVE